LTALFEEDVRAVHVRGGLSDYQSVLQGSFCYLPHDVVVPGALATGDLCDLAGALAPCPVRLEMMVDGLNRVVSPATLTRIYAPALDRYETARAKHQLSVGAGAEETEAFTRRIVNHLLGH
jgi:hypothetical protein